MPDSSAQLPASIPRHIAIIMDGNGRWARARGLPRTEGHRRGIEAVRRAVKAAQQLDVRYLTLFGFSSENWGRPQTEITDLMGLLRVYLRSEIDELDENGVRLRVIGERSRLAPDIRKLIDDAEVRTASNRDYNLTVALSYGGRQDIVQAAQALAKDAAEGTLAVSEITEARLSSSLMTAGLPDPDMLIRTSGEKRISNFLLWQCAYAELVFLETLWPEFSRADLEAAIDEFQRRERRYGVLCETCP